MYIHQFMYSVLIHEIHKIRGFFVCFFFYTNYYYIWEQIITIQLNKD